MSKGTGIIAILATAALAAGIYLGRKKKAGEKLQFLPKGIKLTGKFPQSKLSFLLDVVNPSDTDLEINAVFADVNVNGKPLGRIERTEKQIIAPLNTTSLLLPIKISLANIPAYIKMISELLNGRKQFELQVFGTANAQGIDTEINNTYALKL